MRPNGCSSSEVSGASGPHYARLALAAASLLVIAASAQADVPGSIPTQGALRDAAGNLAPDGQYMADFAIFDAPEDGGAMWSEKQTINVLHGIFHVRLGAKESLSPTIFADGGNRWVEVAVEGEPPLPRWPVGSAAYSFRAANAATAYNLSCTGCVELSMLATSAKEALAYTDAMAGQAATKAGFVKADALSEFAKLSDLADYVKLNAQGKIPSKLIPGVTASAFTITEYLNPGYSGSGTSSHYDKDLGPHLFCALSRLKFVNENAVECEVQKKVDGGWLLRVNIHGTGSNTMLCSAYCLDLAAP